MADQNLPPQNASDGTVPQLFAVDPQEITTILALSVPAHAETTFDDAQFLDLVAHSFSITIDEKKEIVASVPKFSQHQVDELFRILQEERVKFAELNTRHAARLQELEAEHAKQWDALDAHAKQAIEEQHSKEDDERKAEEIRKQMGL